MTDAEQDAIIKLNLPSALVLAGPGCGKTHILAQRVYYAALGGVVPSQMLCLTFTNRAAREMQQRIEQQGKLSGGPFVGNLHRFCMRFLFANKLVHPDSTVIDEDDFDSFISSEVPHGLRPRHHEVAKTEAWMFQKGHNFEPYLMLHKAPQRDMSQLAETARRYHRFKIENHLLDFDDLLLRTYIALRNSKDRTHFEMCGYRWIQIDEVQDLTPLQLAIVDLVKADNATVLYLGDEQQSIYSFAGDTAGALASVKRRCGVNIYHLSRNYRSPKELVELCNSYATQFLGIEPEYLPVSVKGSSLESCLTLVHTQAARLERINAIIAANSLTADPAGTVAVLTRTNTDAVNFSQRLQAMGVEHLLISQNDLFKSVDFKTVWSHLAVCLRPQRTAEWARLLYQTKACRTLGIARRTVREMALVGLCPEMLLDFDAPSDIERYVAAMESDDVTIAVVDTETTGLNVFDDDVVQISAIKIRGGKIVEGSRLSIFVSTDKSLPAMLGDAVNPLAEIYSRSAKLHPAQALRLLSGYLDGCIVAGHNISFDLGILRHNYSRYVSSEVPAELRRGHNHIDTLTISRLLYPRLWNHSLKYMLGYLGVEGENSHNADDDVLATANLLMAFRSVASAHIGAIEAYRSDGELRKIAERFTREYGSLYRFTTDMLDDSAEHYPNSLSGAFNDAYLYFLGRSHIKPIPHVDYVMQLIEKQIVDPSLGTVLRTQLENHLQDLLSFNEGDLYAQGIISERLVVMTIHKAKGMEMDTVILHNASCRFGDLEEAYRVFYVAISRAKVRLYVGFSSNPDNTLGYLTSKFNHITPSQMAIMLARGY